MLAYLSIIPSEHTVTIFVLVVRLVLISAMLRGFRLGITANTFS